MNSRFFFISPHLDDAILSAGALLYDLRNQGVITIITIFSGFSKKETSATKNFVLSCGETDTKKLFLKRQEEDKMVCRLLKVKYVHLGYADYLWRDDSSLAGKAYLQMMKKDISKRLQSLVQEDEDTLIFCPLGWGDHSDHLITKEICQKIFSQVIFWQDYPYCLKTIYKEPSDKISFFEYKKNLHIKEKLIKIYQSQIINLFGDKPIILPKEKFFCQE